MGKSVKTAPAATPRKSQPTKAAAKPQSIEVVEVADVELPPLLERLASGAETNGPPPEEPCPIGWKRLELLPKGGVTHALASIGIGGRDVRWGDETGRIHPVPPQAAAYLLRKKFHNADPETGAMNTSPLFQIVE